MFTSDSKGWVRTGPVDQAQGGWDSDLSYNCVIFRSNYWILLVSRFREIQTYRPTCNMQQLLPTDTIRVSIYSQSSFLFDNT